MIPNKSHLDPIKQRIVFPINDFHANTSANIDFQGIGPGSSDIESPCDFRSRWVEYDDIPLPICGDRGVWTGHALDWVILFLGIW
jgi:hypothetical protein